ncbi:MAG: dihydroorotase [Candidatus Eremiobacteraeota bacterium]|nr:dihydroorotase [Candidatus Eremiobacteraeota bacterium]
MIVRGGRVIDPAQGIDALLDLRIEGGRIAQIGEHLEIGDDSVLDARNAYVAPGFIDMHTHLREPGQSEKETIASGTAAALAGGFTAVACMPNTIPALDNASTLNALSVTVASRARCRVYPIAAISAGRLGKTQLDYAELQRTGVVAFSDDGNTVDDAAFLLNAAIAAAAVPGRFISHCEDARLKGAGAAISEDAIVARDLLIAQQSAHPWHIAHLSTRNGVEFVRWAKHRGIDATCEVTPHHLVFGDEDVERLGAAGKVNPPLRSPADVQTLREAVIDGTIDAFATDHAPHTAAEKSGDLHAACVGFSGLEIALGAYALAVPALPIMRYVELLSTNPARLLGVTGGSLKVGEPADISIFADRRWRVEPRDFYSKGKSTPFAGRELPRRAVAVIIDGRLVMQNGALVS